VAFGGLWWPLAAAAANAAAAALEGGVSRLYYKINIVILEKSEESWSRPHFVIFSRDSKRPRGARVLAKLFNFYRISAAGMAGGLAG